MYLTIHSKYKYFDSTVQRAEHRRQKFHFCRLPFAVNVMINPSIGCQGDSGGPYVCQNSAGNWVACEQAHLTYKHARDHFTRLLPAGSLCYSSFARVTQSWVCSQARNWVLQGTVSWGSPRCSANERDTLHSVCRGCQFRNLELCNMVSETRFKCFLTWKETLLGLIVASP